MEKKYQKPKLIRYGNLEDITKASQIKGIDGSDNKSSAS
jgi:hypothetical protein